MIIYPAMDLIGGRAVRLQQGRFDEVTAYPAEPLEALRSFAAAGAEWAPNRDAPKTWYSPGPAGYIDYPTMDAPLAAAAS